VPFVFGASAVLLVVLPFLPLFVLLFVPPLVPLFAARSLASFSCEANTHCHAPFCLHGKSSTAHRMVPARLLQEVLPRNPLSLSETCRVARIMHMTN
jgi:hypothetical protein